ncbi:MAG: TlpA family protein disulfide reductase [Gammaproteobacteria bacterium]
MHRRYIVFVGAALTLAALSNGSSAATGRAAPNCSLTPVGDGQNYDTHHFRGKVLYVDFWASWCSPCAQSFPFMNALDREFRDRGLQMLGINLDEEPEDARAFLTRHPANFNVAFDAGGRCPQDFGVKAMPSSYLVDRQGNIRDVHLGFRRGEVDRLRALVEQLLAEGPADE